MATQAQPTGRGRSKSLMLFGSSYQSGNYSQTMTSQRRVNCFYSQRRDKDKSELTVFGTPGLSLFAACSGSGVRGLYTFSNGSAMYAVSANALCQINIGGSVTVVGTVNNNTTPVAMVDNGTQLLILDGINGWIYVPATNTLTKIADANFPQNATSCIFNDGFFLVNDPSVNGQFRKSAILDGTTWSSTDIGIAQSSPDPLVKISLLHGLVICFGSTSIEFWQDFGTLGFPYGPIKAATQDFGLVARSSAVYFDNSLAFLGQSLDGMLHVMQFDGFTPRTISTPDIDDIIEDLALSGTVADAIGLTYSSRGHLFYQLTFPSANRTLLYDGTVKEWSEAQSGVSEIPQRHRAQTSAVFANNTYIGDSTTGNIYLLSDEVYTENGAPILRLLQTKHIFDEENLIGIDEVRLDMETGVGLQAGQGSNPQIMMQVSKDGGRTFGNERWASLGAVGQYLGPRVVWRRLGAGRDFVIKFKMTDPVPFTINNGALIARVGRG